MSYETLVTPKQLHAHLGDPAWAIVDCRFDLVQTEAGRQAYDQGHIPGAHYAHLDADLSSEITPASGRHPLPNVARLTETLARWGISNATQVVAYDNASGAFAARLWWLLRWLGHRKVAVLDGGLQAWLAAGYALDTQAPATARAEFKPQLQPDAWLTTEQVQQQLANGEITLIDARAADRFAGRNESIDPVAGHVPGARNHPFASDLDAEQRFLPAEELRSRWLQDLNGADPTRVVCMCGSGVTACHNLLALEVAGLRGARLYAGSWSEWIRDPKRPVASESAG